jgi:hypothetical protein
MAITKKKVIMEEKKEKEVPLFRSWTGWYALVLGFLIFLIGIFLLITESFS